MTDQKWYWDLKANRAVESSERDTPDHLLGPYPTEEAAQNWKAKVEARNEAWKEDDERWSGDDDKPSGESAGGGSW